MKNLEQQWHDAMKKMPLVAILRGVEPEEAVEVASVLIEQGFTIIEVPLNSPRPFDSLTRMTDELGDKALIGAGTVLTVKDVKACEQAGVKLIIAPNFDPEVAQATVENNLIYCPGVLTPSEAFSALKAGANALKLFPAELVNPGIVRALRAVIPDSVTLLAVGGINPSNMGDFCAAGASGFGIGSALYKSGKSLDKLRASAKEFVGAFERIRDKTA